MSEQIYLFVYGSLRKGLENNHILKEFGAEFIANGNSSDKLLLIGAKSKAFPYLIDVQFGTSVTGEIYKINKDCLNKLDELEGHPHFYTRKNKIIFYKDCGLCPHAKPKLLSCQTYVIDNKKIIEEIISKVSDRFDIIESGDWLKYKNNIINDKE